MAKFIISFAILASLLHAAAPASKSDLATCKKICQNVGGVFKSVPKPGPQGKPGPVGPPGPPASTTEHTKLKLEVDAKITVLSELWHLTTLDMKMKYDETLEQMKNALKELKAEVKNTRDALCPLRYKEKCFWAVFKDHIKYSESEELCARMAGGKPANVYDKNHYNFLVKYLRTLVPDSQKFMYFWLGMKLDTKNGNTTFADGSSPNFIKWRANYPSSDLEYTALMFMVRTDGNHQHEGLYNQNPEYGKPGVLCET